MLFLEPNHIASMIHGNVTEYGAHNIAPCFLRLLMTWVHLPSPVRSDAGPGLLLSPGR